MRGRDRVSTHLPPDPRASIAQSPPRSRSGAGCKLKGPQPCPAAQPQPGASRLLTSLGAPPSGPHPGAPCSTHGPPRPGKTPDHTSWLCPGLPANRLWEGVGQAHGVPLEQWTDRTGQAEACGHHPRPATTRSPAGALGSGCRRHRWAMASRLLRDKGHSGAEGTGQQALGGSLARWALPGHSPAPQGSGWRGRGAWPQVSWTPGHTELQAQGIEVEGLPEAQA